MYSIEKIKKEIADSLNKAIGGDFSANDLISPPRPEMGDLAVGIFSLARKLKKNPHVVSSNIADYLGSQGERIAVEKAVGAGPYVNIFLDKKKVNKAVLQEILEQKEKYGRLKIGEGKQVMIEYSQPNTHKEFHVGHLRNVCLGNELVNLYKNAGYKVIAANYIGDIGAHVAKCLWGYLKIKNEKLPSEFIFDKKNKSGYLGQVYTWATREVKNNPEYKKEISEIQQKLEAGDKKLIALWKKTRKWSLDEFKKIYKSLGVEFDKYYFESEVEKPGKKLVRDLHKKDIARESEGAIIMDLIPYDLGVFLLLKSDGTSLYATKDLALAKKKFEDYKLDESIYVVDARQSQYFRQLFKTLELIGFKKPMKHLVYEFVTLPEGAMSSREGNIVTFEEFYNKIISESEKETVKRHKDWSKKKVAETAKKIALAAIKFDILKHDAGKVVQFNIKAALSFDGFTGPYIQYTIARINSIFKKAGVKKLDKVDFSMLKLPEEKKLALKLAEFPEVLKAAYGKFEMSLLPRYLYDLAKEFAGFYHEISVIKSDTETKKARLVLIKSVEIVLSKGLEILGIETLTEM